MNSYNDMLDELKNGTRKDITVDKNEFYAFREVLVKREDFKHFRGVAKQGGQVIYQYMEVARS
ncbi:hypothetical protein MKZ08_17920 [Viridibacillus sp. FSL R5-0477]|uniref:Abortive phage infection protein n=1 Tax=Viridibacillus arenosi FSL R5-213 TaxID=1227360 RepID=W4F0R5_9BACL|nr:MULTISPECIES: hypothetical protein [Viridibacillus]ETT85661.1 hypothetical protein C176_09532 [Viridibacillus arenosi FSL R5-213]OMC83077.1 hypothetical protein BK130_10100 [Viridibacillus sp. FSL H8-0123]OMC88994.1 hypothetical protein BK128_03405 [Viridibacillus sp. FSL H7-0596]OMC93623.1 hypothetical protein BK137_03680 [Viridibacillus arenosi]